MAFGGLGSIGTTSPAASANLPALRMQTPAPTVVTPPTAPVAPTPPVAPAAPAAPAAPSSPDAVASAVVDATNQARTAAGLAPLTIDAHLTTAATAHSADQAAAHTMSHTGTNGSTPAQRITAAGYTWWTWGENVAAGQKTANLVVDAWMNSPGHRANILNPNFTNIGIGSITSDTGVIYWTMDLGA
jgi:uncharacterized protein YkwD